MSAPEPEASGLREAWWSGHLGACEDTAHLSADAHREMHYPLNPFFASSEADRATAGEREAVLPPLRGGYRPTGPASSATPPRPPKGHGATSDWDSADREALECAREQRDDLRELLDAERYEHAVALNRVWHEGYGAGSSNATDGWLNPGSPTTTNPYPLPATPPADNASSEHVYVSTSRDHHFCDRCSLAEDDDRANHIPAASSDASGPLTPIEESIEPDALMEAMVHAGAWAVIEASMDTGDREPPRGLYEQTVADVRDWLAARETKARAECAAAGWDIDVLETTIGLLPDCEHPTSRGVCPRCIAQAVLARGDS